jgi:hypothetical protein
MDDESDDPAERLYAEGKRFDWKQGESPAAATLARVNFQRAAEMGHKGAVRALAHMIYAWPLVAVVSVQTRGFGCPRGTQ